jgi:hypothetical protein
MGQASQPASHPFVQSNLQNLVLWQIQFELTFHIPVGRVIKALVAATVRWHHRQYIVPDARHSVRNVIDVHCDVHVVRHCMEAYERAWEWVQPV